MQISLRKRSIYLLPNLITTGSLFCGFYSIYASLLGNIALAAAMIFLAMIMDTLDGRIARITHTQSKFGAGYDSLIDIVSFGIAPSLLAYSLCLQNVGDLGWLAAFFYVTATALRLARFNTRTIVENDRYFQGLPCTLAAGFTTILIWLAFHYELSGPKIETGITLIISIISLLMISSIPYHSFKNINFKKNRLWVALLLSMLLGCFIFDPKLILVGILSLYVLSGPFLFCLKKCGLIKN